MLEVKELQYFVVCADLLSFSKAADVLYTTQPNVSKVVKSLEEKLGFAVFDRDNRGIKLTRRGRQAYEYASRILEQEKQLAQIYKIDDREEFANEQRFENVEEVYSGDIPNIIKNISINDNTYIVIATRGYEGDLISLRSVIDRNPMYIGMIGSMKKWIKVKETLINENINIEKLESVYAPVGINISSNSVDEIAFGIMAEILLVKNNGSLTHRKNKIK